jgi:eukaryotic-like serine/threonine-protein kinase
MTDGLGGGGGGGVQSGDEFEPTSPTVVDKPKPTISGTTTVSDPGGDAATTARSDVRASDSSLITPEQALLHAEALRVRAFSTALAGLCLLGIGLLAVVGGDPLARRLHLGAVAATGVTAAAYAVILRDPRRYRAVMSSMIIVVALIANATGYYYWGVWSPFLAVITVSAYVMSSGESGVAIWIGIGGTLLSHGGLGIAILAGWIDDVGMARPAADATLFERATLLALIELILVGSVLLGRREHADTRSVLAEHDAAVRALIQRDALLAEARAEIREIQAAAGRFTGQRVGRFVLGDVVGRGAMGEVYQALADGGERVAIKLLAPGRLQDDAAHARFAREVRLVGQLSSPHVVKVVEVSPPEASLPYLAMELLEGTDLAAMIKEQPVRAVEEVAAIVTQIAAGLDAAHAAGIVHRDLKPQNVFAASVAGKTVWKVLDFGVSKLVGDGATLTRDHIVGTPGYMAPEQARNETVDARTDVYALGVLAYRLLTGMPPVVPGDPHAMLYEVVYRMPPRPSLAADVAPAIEAVLAIAIAKPPAQRFGSAGDFARAFAAAARGELSPELRARADAVLAKTPWGHWLRRQRERRATV